MRKAFCLLLVLFALSAAACSDGNTVSGITEVTAGSGLTGGGTTASVTLAADTDYLQRRVEETCSGQTAVQFVNAEGQVGCTSELSLATHNHDTAYAAIDHSHDAYALVGHNHDTSYSLAAHDHDDRYLPVDNFTGHSTDTANCVNDTGFIVIGNVQEEFGCSVTCADICTRHGLTCSRAYSVGGMYRACTAVNNNESQYCWCLR